MANDDDRQWKQTKSIGDAPPRRVIGPFGIPSHLNFRRLYAEEHRTQLGPERRGPLSPNERGVGGSLVSRSTICPCYSRMRFKQHARLRAISLPLHGASPHRAYVQHLVPLKLLPRPTAHGLSEGKRGASGAKARPRRPGTAPQFGGGFTALDATPTHEAAE
eukprot:scaffold7672_cov220-Pinguiococcus_pyrenoidosus.AAC.2